MKTKTALYIAGVLAAVAVGWTVFKRVRKARRQDVRRDKVIALKKQRDAAAAERTAQKAAKQAAARAAGVNTNAAGLTSGAPVLS